MSDRFANWTSTADAVRATTKKLEKQRALGDYLRTLDDSDLPIAARLLAGAPFPRRDERVLKLGWSALSGVLLERSGRDAGDMSASYQRHADLVDVAHELVSASAQQRTPPTLA